MKLYQSGVCEAACVVRCVGEYRGDEAGRKRCLQDCWQQASFECSLGQRWVDGETYRHTHAYLSLETHSATCRLPRDGTREWGGAGPMGSVVRGICVDGGQSGLDTHPPSASNVCDQVSNGSPSRPAHIAPRIPHPAPSQSRCFSPTT